MLSGLKEFPRRAHGFMLEYATINPTVVKAEFAVKGEIALRAQKCQARLEAGEKLPFDEVISCNIGNPLAVGSPAKSFPRQLIAAMEYPMLCETNAIPDEVKESAKCLQSKMEGGIGAYTESPGFDFIREDVARFIEKRDGCASDPSRVFLTSGASQAVSTLLPLIISNAHVGVLTPYPTYPLFTAEIVLKNGNVVPYYLNESQQWMTTGHELETSYAKAVDDGIDVRAMIVVNPGNPTGSVMSYSEMKTVVDFCQRHNILLIADEVYQYNIYSKAKPFISFKKVASDMGAKIQLVSLHSISKGFLGECGHRGGYMELCNVSDDVIRELYKLSTVTLCPNTVGQILVDVMVKPPEKGKTQKVWDAEKTSELNALSKRSKKLVKALNSLPGMSCQPADGSMYVFPKLELSKKAKEAAKQLIINGRPADPDTFWSVKLLDEAGVAVVPGSGFGQEHGTNHFRISFLPSDEKMDKVIRRISNFQHKFMSDYA